ncbi:hypothetical protein [Flavobacterium sp. LAR06]|uniref:hypothetical protein n=1 Tax=Flavobacterium sp. LAR06 TaxID=3064897 RepID=UPI0035C1F04B
METQEPKKWYEKTGVVVLFLIFFFPVGLYALWKNSSISKKLKIIVSVFYGLMIIASIGSKNNDAEVKNNIGATNNVESKFNLNKEKQKHLKTIARKSERGLIQNMKDPDSYKNVSNDFYFLNDSIYFINIIYSGTNSFGGRIRSIYTQEGVLSFIKKDSTFVCRITNESFN